MNYRKIYIIFLIVQAFILFNCASYYYKQARNSDTPEAYLNFLSKYPDSQYATQALIKLDIAEYRLADKIKTIYLYRRYIQRFPNGLYVEEVKDKLNLLRYNQAKAADSIQSYREFINRVPTGELAQKAKERLMEIMSRDLINNSDPDLIDEFIKQYPEISNRQQLIERIQQLKFDDIIKRNNIEEMNNYIQIYPQSIFAVKMKSQIDKLLFHDAVKSKNSYIIMRFLAEINNEYAINWLGDNDLFLSWERFDCPLPEIKSSSKVQFENNSLDFNKTINEWEKNCKLYKNNYKSIRQWIDLAIEEFDYNEPETVQIDPYRDLNECSSILKLLAFSYNPELIPLVVNQSISSPLVFQYSRLALFGIVKNAGLVGDFIIDNQKTKLLPRILNPEDKLRLGLVYEIKEESDKAIELYKQLAIGNNPFSLTASLSWARLTNYLDKVSINNLVTKVNGAFERQYQSNSSDKVFYYKICELYKIMKEISSRTEYNPQFVNINDKKTMDDNIERALTLIEQNEKNLKTVDENFSECKSDRFNIVLKEIIEEKSNALKNLKKIKLPQINHIIDRYNMGN